MKKLFIVLFIIAANIMLAQGGGGQVPVTELNVQIFNNQSGATIDFIMEPVIGNVCTVQSTNLQEAVISHH